MYVTYNGSFGRCCHLCTINFHDWVKYSHCIHFIPCTETYAHMMNCNCLPSYNLAVTSCYNFLHCFISTARNRWLINTLSNIEYKLDKLSRQLTVFLRESVPTTSLPGGIKLPVLTDVEMDEIDNLLKEDQTLMEQLVSCFTLLHLTCMSVDMIL